MTKSSVKNMGRTMSSAPYFVLSEPRRHFSARQFYDYSLLGFLLRYASLRNSNIHNPKIGSSCFAKAKHFGLQNAAWHRLMSEPRWHRLLQFRNRFL